MGDDDLPPLVVGADGPDGPLRVRTLSPATRRTLLVGALVAVAGAAAVGALAGSGRAAAASLFIGGALVSATAAVVALVGAVRSEHGGQRVPVRRVVAGVALLLAAPVLLILASGAGAAGSA